MEVGDKLKILADAAKYDVSCSSSGVARGKHANMLGSAAAAGICHSFSEDGRCISLLKILMTNYCVYDCAYCVNRKSNDVARAAFTPEEIVGLTINFYRRNYIEGLFLSSGIMKSPNDTMIKLVEVVKRLRTIEGFNGYIHLKGIPGADEQLVHEAGKYVDRMSYNLELPTARGLRLLAPDKDRQSIIQPMQQLHRQIIQVKDTQRKISSTPTFVPAGQSTQMILGASDERDYHVLKISEALYNRMDLKRVYYSAYVPGSTHPAVIHKGNPPLNREHRMYQADWLLRFYGFKADEILSENQPDLDLAVDPKCHWALRHLELFPMEINKISLEMLLRIPGIGPISARRILKARRFASLSFEDLKGMGVVLKRARHFITCKGQYYGDGDLEIQSIRRHLLDAPKNEQISLFQTHSDIFEDKEAIIRGLLT